MSIGNWSQTQVQLFPKLCLLVIQLYCLLIKRQQKGVSGILSRLAFLKTGFTWIFFRVLQKKSIMMLLIVGILNNFTTKRHVTA